MAKSLYAAAALALMLPALAQSQAMPRGAPGGFSNEIGGGVPMSRDNIRGSDPRARTNDRLPLGTTGNVDTNPAADATRDAATGNTPTTGTGSTGARSGPGTGTAMPGSPSSSSRSATRPGPLLPGSPFGGTDTIGGGGPPVGSMGSGLGTGGGPAPGR